MLHSTRFLIGITTLNFLFFVITLSLNTHVFAQNESPTVLKAEKIELIDKKGTIRARLGTEPQGDVMFRMMSEKGEIRVKLGASSDGSGLVLLNNKTEVGIHILSTSPESSMKIKKDDKERLLLP